MKAKRAVLLVKNVTYFGEFGYLNSPCIRKNIILLFLISSTDKFMLLQQNSVTDVFAHFRPPYWCPCRWHQHGVSIQISKNLGKTFLRKSRLRKIAVIWTLARVFAYFPSSFFPDSGLYLLNGFYFYLNMAWHWKTAIGFNKREKRYCPDVRVVLDK